MTSRISLHTTRLLLATAIAFGAAYAQAASGVAVNRSQEIAVKAGMSAAEVRQVLGRPANVFNYRIAPGPSWTYHVVGGSYATTAFDVDFGPDGKVIRAREHGYPSNG
jgi:hypothetical protein